ncbi:hypothetical protein CB1_000678009 [Camelus ferus]|nr:hypothetical protein CB1_000678009 [Camelus ferus]
MDLGRTSAAAEQQGTRRGCTSHKKASPQAPLGPLHQASGEQGGLGVAQVQGSVQARGWNSSQGASFSFAPVLKLPCFGKTWPSILRPKLAALLERGGRRACTLVTAGHPFPFWRPQRLFF